MTVQNVFENNFRKAESLAEANLLKTTQELVAIITETFPVKPEDGVSLFDATYDQLFINGFRKQIQDGQIVWLVNYMA